jgi:biopolymer transport protein ExbD
MNNKRRGAQELNAGSMADIAFLLLIFFLVTTTMDSDAGIMATLPEWQDDPPTETIMQDRDVFVVSINSFGDMLVEKEPMEINEIRDATIEFLTNPDKELDKPIQITISEDNCRQTLQGLSVSLNREPDNKKIAAKYQKWQKRLDATLLIGQFNMINDRGVISLQNARETRYNIFISVSDELQAGINQLRNELCLKHYGTKYTELKETNAEELQWINVARTVFPYRISEAEPVTTVNVVTE